LTALLISIGVDADTAEKDACRVEHDFSPETFEAIRERYSAGE
jgi:Mn-dependent DtxR family transcriptional regulator